MVNVKMNDKKGNIKLVHYLLMILALPLSFIAFVYYLEKELTIPKLTALFVSAPDWVIYETYPLSIGDGVPEEMKSTLKKIKYAGTPRFEFVDVGDLSFSFSTDVETVIYSSYLVPVGHLYWINETMPTDLSKVYISSDAPLYYESLLSDYTVERVENLANTIKDDESFVGFVDVRDLSFDLKVLKDIEGKYFFDNSEGGIKYSLGISGDAPEFIHTVMLKRILKENEVAGFNADEILKINMTGVTAITRALAGKTNASGDDAYAAELIGEFLADADLTHVSNEISFTPVCTPADGLRFCSDKGYIEALKASGVDIIELTGNHNNDYGSQYNTSTIETYTELGWDHFGGGVDATDAAKILYKELKGTTTAFIGYNYYDTMQGTGAIATDSHAGANSFSFDKMKANIAEAKENADVVIVDFQFQECYSYPANGGIYPYCYRPLETPDQKTVFRTAIENGADIVIGTQAHQPQSYELYGEGIIFYGLGNLYFDQTPWIGTRHGIVLSHYMYQGKLLQTQMTTTNYGSAMQTYVSEGEERELLLEQLKLARP